MALGAVALFVPLAAGRWSLSLLAVPLFASSVVQAYGALTSPQRVTASAYLPSLLTMLAGLLLFFSSALVINGLLLLLIAILAMGGFSKILIAWRADRSYRTAAAVNGFIDLSCAALLWSLSGLHSGGAGHRHCHRGLYRSCRVAPAGGAGSSGGAGGPHRGCHLPPRSQSSTLTTRPSFRASWRCASSDRKGAWLLSSMASEARCTGGTCK